MTIKDGYNSTPMEIIVRGREKNASELWIILNPAPEGWKDDVLAHITTDELITLRDELNVAIRDAVGL